MSWNLNTGGDKREVIAAIDEAAAANHGMPRSVADYLKDAVTAIDLAEGSAAGPDRYLVHVESYGHRPLGGSGSKETCTVTKIRRGSWGL